MSLSGATRKQQRLWLILLFITAGCIGLLAVLPLPWFCWAIPVLLVLGLATPWLPELQKSRASRQTTSQAPRSPAQAQPAATARNVTRPSSRRRPAEPVAPPPHPEYGFFARTLTAHQPPQFANRPPYDVANPAFLQDMDAVTRRTGGFKVMMITGPTGAGKTMISAQTAHAQKRLGAPGDTILVELAASDDLRVMVGVPTSKKSFAAVLKNQDSITTPDELAEYLEFTEFGLAVLPYGDERHMTPDDVTALANFLKKFYRRLLFDADRKLNTPTMTRALELVKDTGGSVGQIMTNKIVSHPHAESAMTTLKARKIRVVLIINSIVAEPTYDGFNRACLLADVLDVPVVVIDYAPQLELGRALWGLLTAWDQQQIGRLAAIMAALMDGRDAPLRPTDHPSWNAFLAHQANHQGEPLQLEAGETLRVIDAAPDTAEAARAAEAARRDEADRHAAEQAQREEAENQRLMAAARAAQAEEQRLQAPPEPPAQPAPPAAPTINDQPGDTQVLQQPLVTSPAPPVTMAAGSQNGHAASGGKTPPPARQTGTTTKEAKPRSLWDIVSETFVERGGDLDNNQAFDALLQQYIALNPGIDVSGKFSPSQLIVPEEPGA